MEEGVLPPLKNKRLTDSYRSGKEFINYEALCRDEDVMVGVGYYTVWN